MNNKNTKKINLETWTAAEKVASKKITHGLYRGFVRPARKAPVADRAKSNTKATDDIKQYLEY